MRSFQLVTCFAAVIAAFALPCYGQQSNFLTLSSGTPPPLINLNLYVTNGGPGATAVGQPPDVPNFTDSANFGDLARVVNGLPAQAGLGLRVRGDLNYVLMVSELSFNVTNLQFRGVEIQGSQDRGSFIRMVAGTPAAAGKNSNTQGTTVNAALAGEGLMLSQLYSGGVNAITGTVIMSGAPPSVVPDDKSGVANFVTGIPTSSPANSSPGQAGTGAGTKAASSGDTSTSSTSGSIDPTSSSASGSSTNNNSGTGNSSGGNTGNGQTIAPGQEKKKDDTVTGGVDIPVFFNVPTGLALGPVKASSPGTFTTTLQFGVFPRP